MGGRRNFQERSLAPDQPSAERFLENITSRNSFLRSFLSFSFKLRSISLELRDQISKCF